MIKGIKKDIEQRIVKILSQYKDIDSAIVYGSRAKGTQRKNSDIDLVLVAPKLDFSQLLQVDNDIDDLLLPYKVDLRLYHMLKDPGLKKEIEAFGSVIYKQ